MQTDPPVTVRRILEALWSAIMIPTPGVARKTALSLIDERACEVFLQLLDREDVDALSGKSVADMTLSYLEGVTGTPGRGICFEDEGWYRRQSGDDENDDDEDRTQQRRRDLHNRILSNVVRKVGSKAIDQPRTGHWVVKVLQACPELVAEYGGFHFSDSQELRQ